MLLLLSDSALIEHFKKSYQPLPFSLSAIRKDRFTGQLGGIPYRKIGGLCRYSPDEVSAWLAGHPIIQPGADRRTNRPRENVKRQGRPTKIETIEATRRGITVPELRAAQVGGV